MLQFFELSNLMVRKTFFTIVHKSVIINNSDLTRLHNFIVMLYTFILTWHRLAMLAYALLLDEPITRFGSQVSYFQFFVDIKMFLWARTGCSLLISLCHVVFSQPHATRSNKGCYHLMKIISKVVFFARQRKRGMVWIWVEIVLLNYEKPLKLTKNFFEQHICFWRTFVLEDSNC